VVDDALRGWSSLRDFFSYATGEAHFSLDALRHAFYMTGSEGIHGMAGGLYPEYLAGLPNLWWLNWLMMGLLALGLLYGLFQVVRGPGKRRRPVLLLLLWFAVPIAMQSRPTAPVYPFYFNLLYPVQFLLVAILLVDGFTRLARVVRTRWPALKLRPPARQAPTRQTPARQTPAGALLLAVPLVLWGAWQVAVLGRLFLFMSQHPTTGGYGIPLKYTRAAALEARRLAGSSEIVVLSTGVNPRTEETPSVFEALLFGHPHRFADGRGALPVPDSAEVTYLVGPVAPGSPELEPVLERLEAMACVRAGPAVTLPDGWTYRLYHRDGVDREDVLAGLARFDEAVPFANGTVFLAAGMPDRALAGGTLDLWLAWWVRSPPPPGTSYHFFAHLLDEDGMLCSQHDGAGFPTRSWLAGDLVLSRFPIPVPPDLAPGRYQVWAGLYTFPDVINVPFLDAAGNPAGDRVALGEVEVGAQPSPP
jgi:hypothetical protein